MWLATWILFATLFATTLYAWLGSILNFGGVHLLSQSYLLSYIPAYVALVAAGFVVNIFWWMTIMYERQFTRFLITDYVVLINQSEREQLISIVEND